MAAPKGNKNALGNKGGAPKEDLSSLPDGWYKHILSEYEEGASDEEIKAIIYRWRGKFSNDLWDRWVKEELEFSETIKTGKILAAAWWYKNGRKNLINKEFNYTGWYMQMKNRFGWKDKTETEHSGDMLVNWHEVKNYGAKSKTD